MMENPQEIIVNGNLLVHLDETDSTNRFIKELKTDKKYRMVVVASSFQTAGRGQGCNRWESEQGKNITFSILIHPDAILPHVQFVISMAISLAIKESLNGYFDDVSIKWPNDIYYKDKKICGILIENNLSGCVIKDSILGIGINVNQRKFVSDAPNPVSMFQILGKETDKEEVLNEVIRHFDYYLDKMNHGDFMEIRQQYLTSLYRKDGFFGYCDDNGFFEARIHTVEDDGHLILTDSDNKSRKYAFKEVRFIV